MIHAIASFVGVGCVFLLLSQASGLPANDTLWEICLAEWTGSCTWAELVAKRGRFYHGSGGFRISDNTLHDVNQLPWQHSALALSKLCVHLGF